MKKLLLFAICAMLTMGAQAQNVMIVEHNNGVKTRMYIDDIARVYFENDTTYEKLYDDMYIIGNKDYSTQWWRAFSKYYQVPAGEVWTAQFDLHINPFATFTWQNFTLIITNDEDRGAANYREYGAIRFDHLPSGNSEWGDYINRDYVTSTLTFAYDMEPGIQQLDGRVTLTVDRSNPDAFVVTMTNGKVTKTYSQPTAMPNLNANGANTNMRFFLVPELSYIEFQKTSIIPIGGTSSASDKQPVSMTLRGVPARVLKGNVMDNITRNLLATVYFEENLSYDVPLSDLQFSIPSDTTTVGTKTITATYSKTYRGETATTPVTATATFELIENQYTTIGNPDNTSDFWSAHSPKTKVAPGETFVTTFTNYTNGTNTWENFVVVLTDNSNTEYAVLRSDNFGWGTGYENNPNLSTTGDRGENWSTWTAAMNGAKVTLYVHNNGDNTASVEAYMEGNDGVTYKQGYYGIVVNSDALYYRLTVDHCHLVFNQEVGSADNSSVFWSSHSQNFTVPVGETYTTRFKNTTSGQNFWNNFLMVLTKEDGTTEYATLRADNYGWGVAYAACTPSTTITNYKEWIAAMDGAMVTATVTNKGGSVDVQFVMEGTDGNTYMLSYTGLSPVDNAPVNFRFTVDNSYLVFE